MPHQPQLMPDQASPDQVARQAEWAAYLDRLREKLQDPEFRAIEGFPIGEDADILALSDPPYYTACPNPFLSEIIERWQAERAQLRAELDLPDDTRDNGDSPRPLGRPEGGEGVRVYHREPFATDVSEGKNDPIYNAHSYHTKVPHKAIMRYILHYTDPGDIVFDGFCGTGMTGVAAQLCGDKKAVESLGYRVKKDGSILDERGQPMSRLGARKSVLVDLSPAATFIAYNYNTPVDVAAFEREAKRILQEVEDECGWMYETLHTDGKTKGKISYTVWSEVFTCPECSREIVFLDESLDSQTKRVKEEFPCPHCGVGLSKRRLDKSRITYFDPVLGRTCETLKRRPVLIEYKVGRAKHTKRIEAGDLALLERIEALPSPTCLVTDELPYMHMTHQRMRIANYGVTHLHHFFLPRARQSLAALWTRAEQITDQRLRAFLLFAVEQTIWGLSLLNRYGPTHFSQVNRYLNGVYYISSLISEVSPWYILDGKTERLTKAFRALPQRQGCSAISTQSATIVIAPSSSIDYIFTDPPFGENIYYADLNHLVESWHRVRTNSQPEAIIDQAKEKRLADYQELMRQAFRAYYHLLKPGRWMTVEFHNSHNSVWNAIQEAILSAGFVVADVRTLDKQQSSYRQVTAASAAKQDLVISAYKPRTGFERRFLDQAGSEEGAWAFIRQHFEQLPIAVEQDDVLEVVAERQAYLLYDRMVAFHIQRGFSVPLGAAEFYAGLKQRFPERDEMYFLPSQAAEYDKRRMQASRVEQLALFVTDEKSAIQWLRRELDPVTGAGPQTYQDLQPKFLRELHQARHEALPELGEVLAQNFLKDELDRWYAPDPARQDDLEKLRERTLLREFQEYAEAGASGRAPKLKLFRTEAVRAGFKHAWRERDYALIVRVAQRLPEAVLQEDAGLLMYYDNALMRAEEEPVQGRLL
ncbi:MAG: hypothetical protein JW850_04345 [Thermoflexales bacterium]|nr:hypothetical protein [Thermoflexales bacterium]